MQDLLELFLEREIQVGVRMRHPLQKKHLLHVFTEHLLDLAAFSLSTSIYHIPNI